MIHRGALLFRRSARALPAAFWVLVFVYAVWPWVRPEGRTRPRTVVFYGFSILGEALNETVFPAFQREWKIRTGQDVEFITSFAGSGTITNQLIMGVPAQLALLSLDLDAQRLADAGLIAQQSWKHLPHGGVLNRTPFIILVRRGNPKRIRDFSDLARPGVKVVHPDPLTSGAANWAILAEYGAAMRRYPDRPKAGYELLLGIWRNVVAQAQSARSARTQFENGFGDALITYEQEALWDKAHGRLQSEIVYPHSTILSEHTLVVLRRNVRAEEFELVNGLIHYLWSPQAQRLLVAAGFRSIDERLNAMNPHLAAIPDPFLVSSFGGWNRAKADVVDRVWKNGVLHQLGRGQ